MRWWVPIVIVPPFIGLVWLTVELMLNEVPPEFWWDYTAAAALCGLASLVIPGAILIDRWRHPPK
jgi:hypothetical protein